METGHSLKSHQTDGSSRGSNLRRLLDEAIDLSTTPRRLLHTVVYRNPLPHRDTL